MKSTQSFALTTAATLAHRIKDVPALARTGLAVAALIVAVVCGAALWNASRPAVPVASTVVTSSHELNPEDITTLPWQIQAQVGGTERSAARAITPRSDALRPEYIITLPQQIQEQVAGQASSPAQTAQALRPEYLVTLPWQVQAQLQATAQAATSMVAPVVSSSHGLRSEYIATLPAQIQKQVAGTAQK